MTKGRRRVLVCAAAAWAIAAAAAGSVIASRQSTAGITIAVLSSRPEMVSGDDALVELRTVDAIAAAPIVVRLNGRDITSLFHLDASRRSRVGLITGLRPGKNLITASSGSRSARIELTTFPLTGPIVSGQHLTPFECRTVESGLGAPLDANCTAARRVDYFYRTTETSAPPSGGRGAPPGTGFKPLTQPIAAHPADLAYTTTTAG